MAIHKVITTIGDIGILDYDGGFVYEHFETGKPELEYYIRDFREEDDDDESKDTYTVYACLVEDPGGWVEWGKVGSCTGAFLKDDGIANLYTDIFASGDPVKMACAIEDAASYYGWENFDSYPLHLSRAEAEERIAHLFGRKYA